MSPLRTPAILAVLHPALPPPATATRPCARRCQAVCKQGGALGPLVHTFRWHHQSWPVYSAYFAPNLGLATRSGSPGGAAVALTGRRQCPGHAGRVCRLCPTFSRLEDCASWGPLLRQRGSHAARNCDAPSGPVRQPGWRLLPHVPPCCAACAAGWRSCVCGQPCSALWLSALIYSQMVESR